jgi:hypothetical protein
LRKVVAGTTQQNIRTSKATPSTLAQVPTHALNVEDPFMLLKIGAINLITKVGIKRKIMVIVKFVVIIGDVAIILERIN